MTWSISEGETPLRFMASAAAWAPRSIAVTSANAPLYSAIGVRAPSRMTISRSDMSYLSRYQVRFRPRGGFGTIQQRRKTLRLTAPRQGVEPLPHLVEVGVRSGGVNPIGQEHGDAIAARVHPDRG